ncbi:MAG: saccharopine dehydrogenase [Gammaproteobacteria bacterium]|nr:saccharopine dehydrogenase [Gammaproteobacteria bacterium]
MASITVLGAGLVGRAIVADLCQDYSTRVVDIDKDRLDAIARHYAVDTVSEDLADPAIVSELSAESDLVVCAVPGFMGFRTLRAIIEADVNVVDISFFNRDPFELDALANEHQVVAVVDCGVAPGMSNIVLGYHDSQMQVSRFDCMVGGLPLRRTWPYEYKAPFSPIDVIEEYVRPARLRINGETVTRAALTEAELVDLEQVGTLEAFNTDGLRTLLDTMQVPNMRERTLRYPGHCELMRVLRETGFFDTGKIRVGDDEVRPLDLTTALLFPLWQAEPGEDEFTVMAIEVEGVRDQQAELHRYELYDRNDATTGLSSMARTTGFTATAAARLVLDGDYDRVGISPPEYVGAAPGCFDRMLALLAARGVHYRHSVSPLTVD